MDCQLSRTSPGPVGFLAVPSRARIRRLPWELRYQLGDRIMSESRRLLVWGTHRHCRVEFRGPVRIGPGFELNIPHSGTLLVGSGVDFRRGFVCEILGTGRVTIGDRSVFTSHALVQCTTSIEVGERCVFGQSTLIVDGYHRYRDPNAHWDDQGYEYRPIRIADGVGVSDKCTVQADIGERAMIGSGSVVNRPIPAYCLAIGTPARVVRYFGPPEQRPTRTSRPRRRTTDRYLPS